MECRILGGLNCISTVGRSIFVPWKSVLCISTVGKSDICGEINCVINTELQYAVY